LFGWATPSVYARASNGNNNGHETAPITSIANAIGAKVDYNSRTGKVTILFNNTTIEMQVDAKVALVNGVQKTMPVPVTGNPGTVFVPVRFVAEALGLEATINKGGKVKIKFEGNDYPNNPQATTFSSLGSAALRFVPCPDTPYVYLGVAKNTLINLQGVDQDKPVLVVSRGMVNTGGHDIKVKETKVINGSLEILVELINPPAGSMNTQVINYPYEVIYFNDKVATFGSWILRTSEKVLATGAIGQSLAVVNARKH